MDDLTGVFVGKVVDNRDPLNGGRVRVFCSNPRIHNYYASLMTSKNIHYRFPGNDDLSSDFIRQIKPYLSWARIMGPVMGGSAAGKFDAANNFASRSNNIQSFGNSTSTLHNVDGRAVTPMEALMRTPIIDAFASPVSMMVAKGNAAGSTDYNANTFEGAPSGCYNIPRVGSTVGVIFLNGDINKPIVVGSITDIDSMNANMTDGGVPFGLPGNFESA